MPFGLKNAPSTFQSMIDSVLGELLGVCVVAYLDDLLIYSENEEDHADHLRAVAQKLRNANLVAKLSKCEFFKSEVTFLGNIILKEGHAICPDKCEAILNWPTPTTRTELKRFMGTVNFLRKFCVGISGVAAPLSRLGSEKVPFKWTKECEFAFCQIKNLFTEAPLLRHADPTKQFILERDASNYAYAGVLLQEFEGKEHPISYYSGNLLILSSSTLSMIKSCMQLLEA